MLDSFSFAQIDGIELMTELLQNEGWSHIPIIGMLIITCLHSVLSPNSASSTYQHQTETPVMWLSRVLV